MIRRAIEKELLRQTFQLFPSTTMLVTESLNASDRCQGQPPLKRDVTDLAKRHYLSGATNQQGWIGTACLLFGTCFGDWEQYL